MHSIKDRCGFSEKALKRQLHVEIKHEYIAVRQTDQFALRNI